MPYTYAVQEIIRVIDGDTVVCRIDLGFGIFNQTTFRLLGIDTPEMRGEGQEAGQAARQALTNMLSKGDITIHTHKDRKGKYGRYLAEFFSGGVSINQSMVELGHAKPVS